MTFTLFCMVVILVSVTNFLKHLLECVKKCELSAVHIDNQHHNDIIAEIQHNQ
jgi:hypothetical protein